MAGWSETRGLPTPATYGGFAVLGNYAYWVGGSHANFYGSTPTNKAYRFDGDTWVEVANLPAPRSQNAVCAFSNALYSIGGLGEAGFWTTNVFRFDGSSWTEVRGLPVYRLDGAATTLSNALYFIGGGDHNSGAYTNVYRFNGTTWTEVEGLPRSIKSLSAVTFDGAIYVVGGHLITLTNVYRFDGAHWTEVRGLPAACVKPAAAAYGNAMYCIGGWQTPPGIPQAVGWSWDGADWKTSVPLPGDSYGGGAAVLNEKLYVARGSGGGVVCSNVYAATVSGDGIVTPNAGSWTGGIQVVIGGDYLGAGDVTNVTICGVAATIEADHSPTQLVVRTGAASGPRLGHIAVYSTSYGCSMASNAFTYLAPVLKLRGTNGAVIGSDTGVSPVNGTDFGNVWSQTAATNIFSITNSGNMALNISGYTTNGAGAGQFAVSGVSSVVEAGGVSNFTVRFDASAVGAHTCAVVFVSDATNNTYVLNLAATSVKSNQTITFPAIAPQKRNSSVGLAATADSGLPVSFAVSSGPGSLADSRI